MFKALMEWLFTRFKPITGRMLSSYVDENGNQIVKNYSTYAEYEFIHEDEKLFIRFVATYGMERIPKEHPFFKPSVRMKQEWIHCFMLPCVGEIYFLNYSNHLISVKPTYLKMNGETLDFQESFDISSREFATTTPLVQIISNLSTEIDIKFGFEYEGETREIDAVASRKTTEAIQSKYSLENNS